MAFEQPSLPFDKTALEPHMSAKTLEFHHGKHHRAYVDTLNKLIPGTDLEGKALEQVITATAGSDDAARKKIFNNAAQVWNHSFFWSCLKPGGGGAPTGDLARRIDQSFGGLDKFKEAFKNAGAGQFGSGWAWLVLDGDALKVLSTPNAVPPMVERQAALLTCDVWEHAYYLDYQNRRPDFVQAFLDSLVNWEFAADCLSRAESAAQPARKQAARR